jgi:hypothetical protein
MNDTRRRPKAGLTREQISELVNWLRDGRELARLQKLFTEAKTHPQQRRSRRYAVRNPDGSIYRSKKQRAHR